MPADTRAFGKMYIGLKKGRETPLRLSKSILSAVEGVIVGARTVVVEVEELVMGVSGALMG